VGFRVLSCSAVLFLATSLGAETFVAVCVAVRQGDALRVARDGVHTEIRLVGIDAPDPGQAYAERAAERLSALVMGQSVTVSYLGKDRQGRLLARVSVGPTDVNEALVNEGMAWYDPTQSDDPGLDAAQVGAQAARRGLWADQSPEAPWEYRRRLARPVATPLATPSVERTSEVVRSVIRRAPPTGGSNRGASTFACLVRIGDNMYRDADRTVVWTQHCSYEPQCENAEIVEGSSPSIRWARGTTCWVVKVARHR
jgi:micrococcal nuclease